MYGMGFGAPAQRGGDFRNTISLKRNSKMEWNEVALQDVQADVDGRIDASGG